MDIILTHENTDFDGVAAALAAHKLEPSATPVAPRRANRNVRHFLALYWDALPFILPDDLPQREHVDRVLLVDTQNPVTVRGMDAETKIHIVDHHPLARDLPPGWTFAGEPLGATTTQLVEKLAARGVRLTVPEATLMLLGIYEDTGSLTYVTTTARDARCAAWLLDPERGASLAIARDFLYPPLSQTQRTLYERVLANLETLQVHGHKILVAGAETPEPVEEISTIAHKLRDLYDVHGLFLLVGMGDHVQVVARSTTDNVDVGCVAKALGGGGHARAAAAFVRGKALAAVRAELLAALPEAVRPPVTVAHIMSRGVQTLHPGLTVREAAERMRRYEYEGFPVVDDGRVVGLLTRRAVDRAERHGLDGVAIDRIMDRGEVTVTPEDSIERLQKVMMESGWGQVPVVAQGEVAGVVTRTDLIKLITAAEDETPRRRADVVARLQRALPPAMLDLVRHIAAVADGLGYAAYFVGGLVRDLLLDQPVVDVDLVIEGEALTLARRLAREMGGKVRGHERFGTAKWFLPEALAGAARPVIDFVTARSEFYAHPTALPEVEHSSIKLDLHRRDFTINTLAIALAPDRFGELLDFWGGGQDLRDGVIRVLHSLSFVEDPTRILRAARLEQRLGFRVEPRTAELMHHALPLLDRVSGDRIRHELELALREKDDRAERTLARFQELGALAGISPALQGEVDEWLAGSFATLRAGLAAGVWPEDFDVARHPDQEGMTALEVLREFAYFGLLVYRLDPPQIESILKRLHVKSTTIRDVRALHGVQDTLAWLNSFPQMPASEVVARLEPFPPRALLVGWVTRTPDAASRLVERYWREWRFVRTALDGAALKALGLPPSPLYGRLLGGLRAARLDGLISTEEEERALLQQWLAQTDQ